MTRQEAIAILEKAQAGIIEEIDNMPDNMPGDVKKAVKLLAMIATGKTLFDALEMAIDALEQEPTNCAKCQHFYETEDSTGIYSHCFIHELHKAAEDAENAEVRKGIIKAIEILKREGTE